MSKALTMTEADISALEKLPKGWFEWFELMVRCPEFRLERLEQRGVVEHKLIGEWPNIEKRYRVIRKHADIAINEWNAKQNAKWRQNAEGKWERVRATRRAAR